MSTYCIAINDRDQARFPIELLFAAHRFLKELKKLAKYSAGIIILIPVILAIFLLLPIIYVLLGLIFLYYVISLKRTARDILKSSINDDEYALTYQLYISNKKFIGDLQKINQAGKSSARNILLGPFMIFINTFNADITRINKHLEGLLFEKSNDNNIKKSDIDSLKNQLKALDHDWDNDELWDDFQIKHHQLAG